MDRIKNPDVAAVVTMLLALAAEIITQPSRRRTTMQIDELRERYATIRRTRARLVRAHLSQPDRPHVAEIAALDEQLDEIEAVIYDGATLTNDGHQKP